ncbi:MAG TPA: hypothetical protein VM509_09840 [Planctomycetota bacterium]|nr:hypothetical protein [Planctomycetota bacterium]
MSTVHEFRGKTGRAAAWMRVFAWIACAVCGVSGSANAQANAVVAQMELGAPASTTFVLHGTLPIPPGVYPRADQKLPFALVNPDGSLVDTQIEQVSAYPKASDGADVIELIGRVKLPPNTAPGTRVVYKVVNSLHARSARSVTPVVESLLLHPATVMIVAKDCFGNTYGTDLSPGSLPAPSVRIETQKSGIAATQVRTYGTMLPQANTALGAPTGALQHLFGVHGYFTAWQGEDVVSLDLRVNNGASGLDPTTPIDNPLGKVYFKSLELWVKSGWNVLQQGSDPLFGDSMSQGNWTSYSLVEPNADGTLHFMPSQGQFVRRLALCKIGQEVKARALLNDEGQAFCKRGVSPTGQELYSWWNPLTARYFPQRHRLPELDYIGQTAIRAKLAGQLAILESAMTTGQIATGYGMIGTTNLGWAHPWGVKYGGMTGGGEITIFDGVLTAESASNEGYRIAQLTHRAYNDRQPDALYNKDGRPTELLQWTQTNASGPYVNMKFYGKLLAGPDPFGFNQAQTYQVAWVSGNNKKPAYEATLGAFMPIDLQHNIRITRSMKVLAWLGNDTMAKDDLRMRAELFRMSWHNLPNNANNVPQAGGLLDNFRAVSQTPGSGFKVGRGEGWGIDTVNAAYSLGEASYRASVMPWYSMMASTFALGQSPCNGYLQSQVSMKQLNGMYYQRQQYEASIIENGLRGAVESALRGADPASATALETVLRNEIGAMISPMAWDPVQRGPWKNLAMAPLTSPSTTYCNFIPPGGTSPGVEKFQNWCSYAYGYAISHDQNLLNFAKSQMGGDLLLCFKSQKFKDIDNRAALIALVERP